MGGEDTDENCEVLCVPDHARKTALDAVARAKAKRLAAKNADPETRALAKPKGRKMQSRPFQKARKP
jgi:hypothetical protein